MTHEPTRSLPGWSWPKPARDRAQTEVEPFDLTQLPYDALRRVGVIFREGEGKYGRDQWRTGVHDPKYQRERMNHALKHLLIHIHYLSHGEYLGTPGEQGTDLAKVVWGCLTQMELERLEHGDRHRPRQAPGAGPDRPQ